MKTSNQFGDNKARMNRVMGKPFKLLVRLLLVVVIFFVARTAINDTAAMLEDMNGGQPVTLSDAIDLLDTIDSLEVAYPWGIQAVVFFNPYNGMPHVDSSMSYSDLEFADHVDSVNWFVPDDAQAYYIASVVQADSASIERYLSQISEP